MSRTRKPKTMESYSSGSPGRPGAARTERDDFQTDPDALEPLLPFLPHPGPIWECAAGHGRLAARLRERGFSVVESDLNPRLNGTVQGGRDFLSWKPPDFAAIVTNPPFSLKGDFLARCYALGRPFALLLPLTTFESRVRQALFREHGVEVIFLPKRVDFVTPSGLVGGSWFAVAWFTWGLGVGRELTFWEAPTASAQPALDLESK